MNPLIIYLQGPFAESFILVAPKASQVAAKVEKIRQIATYVDIFIIQVVNTLKKLMPRVWLFVGILLVSMSMLIVEEKF